MEPFSVVTAVAAPIDMDNVDTDMITPSRFLRKPRTAGYGNFLFADIRRTKDGAQAGDFVLDQPVYREAKILVAGLNFGCGSSRVGAVYAIADSGIRSVIAAGFGDIFANSCIQHGVLPVSLSAEACAAIRRQLRGAPGSEVTVDLVGQRVVAPDGSVYSFEVSSVSRDRLMRGLDDITRVLVHASAIAAFEEQYFGRAPWRLPDCRRS
jgi:3-isopropylmalate/(R)-2-methylmalate dehydratase small subunit